MKKRIAIMLSAILSLVICTGFVADTLTKNAYPETAHNQITQSYAVAQYCAEYPADVSNASNDVNAVVSESALLRGTHDLFLLIDRNSANNTKNAVTHFDTEDIITLYAQDGRTICVHPSERAAYNAVGWYNEPFITVYAQDGRTLNIQPVERAAYNAVGWYNEPFITVYAQDGRTLNIQPHERAAYNAVGWYNEPFITVYAQDGRTLNIQPRERAAYNAVGWYNEPFTTLYAQDGRTINVQPSEVEAYLNVGWYKSWADMPVSAEGKLVALTFDDGPSSVTERILNCLEKYNAKATFFVIGTSAKKYPNILKRAYDMGMEIGNHTMNHKKLTTLGTSGIKSQFSGCTAAITGITGEKPTLIRPPYGSYNSTVSAAADAPLILWSIDTLDWKHRDASKTVQAVRTEIKDGSIVLMHDLYSQTAEAAERLIPELIARGYRLVTVSELARAKGYTMQNGKAYRMFK